MNDAVGITHMNSCFFDDDEIAVLEKTPCRSESSLHGAYLFGCGAIGAMMRRYFQMRNIPLGGFVDNAPKWHDEKFFGQKVVSLAEFCAFRRPPLLVLSSSVHLDEMKAVCSDAGLKDVISFFACQKIMGILPFELAMSARDLENSPDARSGMDVWADEDSRQKYRKLLRFYATVAESDILPLEEGQYFSSKYMPRQFLNACVDVGAYTGDTFRNFLECTGNHFEAYYAFEASPGNFAKLVETAPGDDSRVRLFQTGVGAKRETLRLGGAGGAVLKIMPDGEITVPVDTLDHLCGTDPVSLIKMDIEGFEPHALKGAEQIIRRQRPALAISVYHRMDHFWMIPAWLKGLRLDYSLRLGCHNHANTDVVCYALPERS